MPRMPWPEFALLLLLSAVPLTAEAQNGARTHAFPITFEENHGQSASAAPYRLHHDGIDASFVTGGVDFRFAAVEKAQETLHLGFSGSDAVPQARQPLSGHTNYFFGNDPAKWLRNVPLFAQVEYPDLYPGISLSFYGNGEELEHDFRVAPGANPANINFHLDGRTQLTSTGDLAVHSSAGVLILRKPVAYQEISGKRESVAAEFALGPDGRIGFSLGSYDRNRTLIIDPVLDFATYLGGTGGDQIAAVTTDSSGNILVAGSTISPDFPVKNQIANAAPSCTPGQGSCQTTFVTKLDPTGATLIYSTFIGSGYTNQPGSIVVDGNGNTILSGAASNSSFPNAGAISSPQCQTNWSCYYLVSISPDGSTLNYSGLIGGEQAFGASNYNGVIATDASGNTYLAGITEDSNFQTTSGTLDPTSNGYPNNQTFVLKVDPTGKLIYSTLIPGNSPNNPEQGYNNAWFPTGIAVDSQGNATVAGWGGLGLPTTSGVLAPNFPNPYINYEDPSAGVIFQLNADATALNYASYLPGTDRLGGLAVDKSGNLWVAGTTGESSLPVSANAYQKAPSTGGDSGPWSGYILEVDPNVTTAVAGTYLDGTGAGQTEESSSFTAIALDSKGNVFVGGMTGSADFPMQDPFVTALEYSGSADGMILAEMSPDLSKVEFGSFLSAIDPNLGGSIFSGLTIDSSDRLIAAGTTSSQLFPTTPGSFEPTLPTPINPPSSSIHSFIAKIDLSVPSPAVCFNTFSVNFGNVNAKTSATITVQATNCGNAPLTISSIASTDPTVTATTTCNAVAPGAVCPITLTYTPVNSFANTGTITLTSNANNIPQSVSFQGQGIAPRIVPSANPLLFGDLLVGTTGPQVQFYIQNQGQATLTISSVTVSGPPFALISQNCTQQSPVYYCTVMLTFAPTATGAATGTLTIASNDPATPQLVVALSGTGDAVYGVPTITANSTPTVLLNQVANPSLTGTNFYPQSVVQLNGTALATTFVSNTQLNAVIPATLLTTLGEQQLTVVNPQPGGGVSSSITITPYQTLLINPTALAYVPATGMIYAAISSSDPQHPNTVIPVDPTTGTLGTPIPVMTNPHYLAASSDGSYLFVAPYDNNTNSTDQLERINLKTNQVDRTFAFPPDVYCPTCTGPEAQDLQAVPGQPTEVLLALGYMMALYNDSGLVNYVPAVDGPQTVDPQFVSTAVTANPLTSYSLPFTYEQVPFFNIAQITDSGLAYTPITYGGYPSSNGNQVITDGTLLYTNMGQIWNPSTRTQTGSFPIQANENPAITLNTQDGKFYAVGEVNLPYGSETRLDAYGLNSQQLVGSVEFPQIYWPGYGALNRWGTDGLAFIDSGVGQSDEELYLLRSSIVAPQSPNATPVLQTLSPTGTVAGSAAFTLTVTGTGFVSSSVVRWNGTALSTSSVTSSTLTAQVPAPLVASAGTAEISVYNPAPGGGTSATAAFPIAVANPEASVSSSTLDFGSINQGTASTVQSITLSNAGNAALAITGIAASGDFSQTNTCGTTLAAGSTCAVSVVFTPSASGARTGTLTVTDNAANSPQSVSLSGTGVTPFVISTQSGASTTATVSSGGTATFALSLTGATGFNGTVNLACKGAPEYATCSISPSSVTLAPGGTANFTVSVTTSTTQTAGLKSNPVLFAGLYFVPLFGLVWVLPRKLRGLPLAVLALAAAAFSITACGGGGSTSSSPTSNQTPPGTYSLTVSATSGSATATQALTLVVN
jgi:Abnormal spindle-like microcephaly-assoc'd, ASPM-SPD-2-Hydin/Protein of unknown function (DUF1573)/Beta-propeller repeat